MPTEDAEFKLLQTGAYSDPNFNSHDGYLLHHSKLERETHAGKVEYDLDPKLDADILSTHSHLADQEAKLGKLSSTNLQVASEVESLEREFSDIKKKVEASDKAAAINLAQQQTKVTAASSAAKFKEVRAKMMSNWGTK